MRFYLAAIVASLFSVSCGENQVRIEIRGGDGNLVRSLPSARVIKVDFLSVL